MRRAFAADAPEKQPEPISFNLQFEFDTDSTKMCIESPIAEARDAARDNFVQFLFQSKLDTNSTKMCIESPIAKSALCPFKN